MSRNLIYWSKSAQSINKIYFDRRAACFLQPEIVQKHSEFRLSLEFLISAFSGYLLIWHRRFPPLPILNRPRLPGYIFPII